MSMVTQIKDFFKARYVAREKVDKMLDRARQDERVTVKAKYERLLKEQRNLMEKENDLVIREKDAKIRSLGVELEEMTKEVRKAKEVYFRAVKRTKENLQVSVEMAVIAESMINDSARSYTKIKDLCGQTKKHAEAIEKESVDELNDIKNDDIRNEILVEFSLEEERKKNGNSKDGNGKEKVSMTTKQ